jgi:hypothetical protein
VPLGVERQRITSRRSFLRRDMRRPAASARRCWQRRRSPYTGLVTGRQSAKRRSRPGDYRRIPKAATAAMGHLVRNLGALDLTHCNPAGGIKGGTRSRQPLRTGHTPSSRRQDPTVQCMGGSRLVGDRKHPLGTRQWLHGHLQHPSCRRPDCRDPRSGRLSSLG